MRSHYNVKCSSIVPFKYHYFFNVIPLIYLSHLGMSLKIPSLYKSGSRIRNYSHFFIVVQSETAQVLLERYEQMKSVWEKSGLWHRSDWLLRHLLMLTLIGAATYRRIKCLINTKVTGQGTLLNEHASYWSRCRQTCYCKATHINIKHSV
jgi:hypothetical protein